MLSKMAKADLDALRASGCNPTDEEIVELNSLAQKIERGKETTPQNMPRIAVVGNTVLHEPTIGQILWWDSYGKDASFSSDDKMMVYYWSLAFATEVEYLNKYKTHREISGEVKRWKRNLNCTEDQLWKGLLWVKYGGDHDNPNTEAVKERLDDDVTMRSLWAMVLKVSSYSGINVEDLMTRTQCDISYMLMQSYLLAHIPIKQSVADDYIAYRMMIKKIEDRGSENGQF